MQPKEHGADKGHLNVALVDPTLDAVDSEDG